MTVKDRLNEYIELKGISVHSFERTAGLSVGYLRQLRKEPSREKIKNIILAYPDINESWLLTGEGEMLKESGVVVNQSNQSGDNYQGPGLTVHKEDSTLIDQLKEKDRQIDRLLSIIEKMQDKKD